ncbi:MAG TPA: AMP-binding protein [Thermodesulfobacteriota bacterium]|nr:AMP-binding protein [Thermodesulfobacteriota bacterium]
MTELLRITVGDLLDRTATRFPESEALVDVPRGARYSYREFLRVVNQMAKGFLKLGLKQGEHVALWAPNLSEWIITEFAIAKIGAVLISVDTNYQLQQVDYLLKQSDCRSLIMTKGLKGSEYIEMIHQLCPEVEDSIPGRLKCQTVPELKNLVLISDRTDPGTFNWREILESGEDVPDSILAERQRSCHEDDIVTILYTSGTTGAPKGVMSSHFGIINTSLASAENQRLTEKDRLCLSVPLSHMFGCVCVALAGIVKGAAIVIPSETFSPGKILQTIEKERCTAIYGSPSAFIALMEDPQYKKLDIRSLRTGIMGGAQCPMEVMKKVVEEMGVREIVIGYGQTEASSWITMTCPDDPLELRVSTVGKSLPNLEVKMIDSEAGQAVPTGVVGEICARGFNMKGYYKMPAATAHTIDSEGWLHTGDLGTMDEEGYVRTTGRLKEVIRKGGEAIYPTEIEEVLFSHPKIINVQVFGVPDKAMGEEVVAWIKLEEGAAVTETDILQYCRGRLPNSHLPRYLKVVDKFPTTPLGKVQKFKMRETAIEEYGLD